MTYLKPPKPTRKITCERCGEEMEWKFYEPIFYLGKPLGKSGHWHHDKLCEKCNSQNAEEPQKIETDEEKTKREHQQRIDRSGLYPRQLTMTFENLNPDDKIVKIAKDFCYQPDFNLFIYGKSGIGKTYLLSSIANEILKEKSVKYFRAIDFLATIREIVLRRNADTSYEEFRDNLIAKSYPILIDDIGAEKVTDFVAEKFYDFLDLAELNERKGIIITSNLFLTDLATRLSDRITSRIAGLCTTLEMTGKDMRLSEKQ